MVANQQDVQEIANLAAQLARQVEKLLDIVEGLEFRIATLERKAKLNDQYPRES
jgi:hypothetical protein